MNVVEAKSGMKQALDVLHSGGLVIHATETCYGIACDLTNPDAVRKLFAVKQRPETQPVSALFSSLDQAKQFVVFSEKALTLAREYLPGPLTIVLPAQQHPLAQLHVCPPPLTTNHYSLTTNLGLRFSSHPLAQHLAEGFGKPIATTSANLHGKPNPYSAEEIRTQFAGSSPLPDLILDSGVLPITPPSTVIEIVGDALRVLRRGDISFF